jgi:hypothetical protein
MAIWADDPQLATPSSSLKAGASLQGCSAESGRSSQPDRGISRKDTEWLTGGGLYPFAALPERDIATGQVNWHKLNHGKCLRRCLAAESPRFSVRRVGRRDWLPFVNIAISAIYE